MRAGADGQVDRDRSVVGRPVSQRVDRSLEPGEASTFVRRIEVMTAQLPFRFSFAHALAKRNSTTNVLVKLTLDDGSTGYGEGVPREYVTGETGQSVISLLCDHYAPSLLGRPLADPAGLTSILDLAAETVATQTGSRPKGASWCALELALLDAAGRHFGRTVQHWLGPARTDDLRYDAVIPFSSRRKLAAVAVAVRLLGFKNVKVKVGRDLEEDLLTLRLLRRALGAGVDLRVDANCAWDVENALRAIERMRPFRLSVIEQPLPADDLEGLRRLRATCEEAIAVDESLRTLEEARALAEMGACDAFNIRVSKCGGLLESMRIAAVAEPAGLFCIVGAQVGETGILSAAGRHLARCIAPRYLEGSAGRLLLKEDLTEESVLPGWGGRARPYTGPGLGVTISQTRLARHASQAQVLETEHARVVT